VHRLKPVLLISVVDEGRGHEGEEEDEEGEEGGCAATGVEGLGIVDGEHAKKLNAEEERAPDVPASPKAQAEKNEEQREKKGREAVRALVEGAKNVAAIELRCGKKIERGGEESDPGGAAYGVKQEIAGAGAVAEKRR
jgi:hypothetical protein